MNATQRLGSVRWRKGISLDCGVYLFGGMGGFLRRSFSTGVGNWGTTGKLASEGAQHSFFDTIRLARHCNIDCFTTCHRDMLKTTSTNFNQLYLLWEISYGSLEVVAAGATKT